MLQRSRLHIILLLMVFLSLIGFLYALGNDWWNWIEPLLAFLILGATLTAWYMDSRQEWEENLEKRLTVHFSYRDRQIMCCEYAHLAGESDIRQLAQQIGAQMSKSKLDFIAAEIKVNKHAPCEHQEGEHYMPYIKPYDVYLTLTECPEMLRTELKFDEEGCPLQQKVWRYPFVKDGKANVEICNH